jgi:hypothetical protein
MDLSREVRRLRRIVIAQVVLLGVVILTAAAQDHDNLRVKTIEAESITVRKDGATGRVVIAAQPDVRGVWVYREEGNKGSVRMIAAEASGPHVVLISPKGERKAVEFDKEKP